MGKMGNTSFNTFDKSLEDFTSHQLTKTSNFWGFETAKAKDRVECRA
jgi:hypothetical protein